MNEYMNTCVMVERLARLRLASIGKDIASLRRVRDYPERRRASLEAILNRLRALLHQTRNTVRKMAYSRNLEDVKEHLLLVVHFGTQLLWLNQETHPLLRKYIQACTFAIRRLLSLYRNLGFLI